MSQLNDKDEIKADHYFFWLSEYRTRNYRTSALFNDFNLKVKQLVDLFSRHYKLQQDNIPHDDKIKCLSLIENTDDYKKINAHYNKKFREIAKKVWGIDYKRNLSKYDVEIYDIHSKILSIMSEISLKTLKDEPWELTNSDTIIFKVINQDAFTFEHTPHSLSIFMKNILPALGENCISWTKREDNSIVISEMKININNNIDLILSEFHILLSLINFYEFQRGNEVSRNDMMKQYKRHFKLFAKNSAFISYEKKSDNARAVGIWLWDYVKENKTSISSAVREIKAQKFLEPLGLAMSSDRTFNRMFSQTNECIEKCEVLAMSK